MIRLTVPSIEEDDLQAVREALLSGQLVQSARVTAFEEAVAKYVGTKYAVAVSNGTAALHLALLALGIRQGDMVLVTAYSWIATANVIELCGAQSVFLDIDPYTFNLDPNKLREALDRLMRNQNTCHRVKAVLPVHTFGQLADMPALLELAGRYDLPVIEDAACALGASLHGRNAGSWGVMGGFSFHPRKAITTGEGGVITTNDPTLDRRLRALRNHGQDPDASAPDFILPGFNYRMTEFQAALGISQLKKIDRILAARRKLAGIYDALLGSSSLAPPKVSEGSLPVYQSYVVLLKEEMVAKRSELIGLLKDQGIETTIGTVHMPLTSYFRSRYGYKEGQFPVTDQIYARSLTLPLYEHLVEHDQAKVVNCLLKTLAF